MPPPITYSYCLDCPWTASINDCSRQGLRSFMIEHAVATGHDIDSVRLFPIEDTDRRADADLMHTLQRN